MITGKYAKTKTGLLFWLVLTLFPIRVLWGQQVNRDLESGKNDVYGEELLMHRVYEENTTVAPYSASIFLNAISIYQRHLSARQCQFYPSCSRYAYRAIHNLGPLKGLPMAAERLMRCHPWAYQDGYETVGFFLYDPVRDFLSYNPTERHRPSISYLRREFISAAASNEPTMLASATEKATELSTGNSTYRQPLFREEVSSELKFGCALYGEGDFYRAVTELKRYLFLFPAAGEKPQVLLLIACSLYKSKRYTETHAYLNEAQASANDMSQRHFVRYVDALSYYSEGNYSRAASLWKKLLADKPASPIARNSLVHLTLTHLELGDENGLRSILAEAETRDDSPTPLITEIRHKVGQRRKTRSPLMAAGFSAVLPGSGQIYSGKFADGIAALAMNGLFAFLVVDSFKKDYAAGKVMSGLLGLQFYLGNLAGANRAAHIHNENTLRSVMADVRDSWLSGNQFELDVRDSTYCLTLD